MEEHAATVVDYPNQHDLDYGEGWLKFTWPDAIYGNESITLQFDRFCSKENSFYSGYGIERVTLSRDRIVFQFSEELAQRLELDRNLVIRFVLTDCDFEDLAAGLKYLGFVTE